MLKIFKAILTFSLFILFLNTYWANDNFALTKAEIVWSKKINLIFNSPLESASWAIRDFKIINKADDLDVINILSNNLVANNKLEINLDKALSVSTDYEINVISIKDNNWNNITKWINWIIAFKTPSVFSTTPVLFVNDKIASTWSVDTTISPDEIEATLFDTWTTDNKKADEPIQVSSSSSSSVSTWNTVVSASKETEKLPQTWPQEIFLVILSLFAWSLFISLRTRKA